MRYFILLGFISFGFQFSCVEENLKDIPIDLNDGKLRAISEIVDSIHFTPLQLPFLITYYPHKIQYDKDYIYILNSPTAESTVLLIFNHAGEYLTHISSSSSSIQPSILTINDFNVHKDSLFVLHDSKLSVYNTTNFDFERAINIHAVYKKFTVLRNGFLCFDSILGLEVLNTEGTLLSSSPLNRELSLVSGDLFDHFSMFEDEHYFYSNFISNIYRVDYMTGDISGDLEFSFMHYDIHSDDMRVLLKNNKLSEQLENELFDRMEKFTFYSRVIFIQDYIVLTTFINSRAYTIFVSRKNTNNYKVMSGFKEDKGLPFLVTNNYLNFYATGPHVNSLVCIIDSEHIASFDLANKPTEINSNWSSITIDSLSGPLVAEYFLKEIFK